MKYKLQVNPSNNFLWRVVLEKVGTKDVPQTDWMTQAQANNVLNKILIGLKNDEEQAKRLKEERVKHGRKDDK